MSGPCALTQQRLHQQGISTPLSDSPTATVKHLLAIQAQDYAAALWAVGLRTAGTGQTTVEQAIAQRRIVRTWPMRGTLHLLAAEDVRWMLALTAHRALERDRKRQERDFGLDAHNVERYADLLRRLLQGQAPMTRSALYHAMEQHGVDTRHSRGLHILGRLAHEGVICQGPREDKQATFVLLEEWLPPVPPLDRDAALATLAHRYFTGHGPASVQDLAGWSGLTQRDATTALTLAQPELCAWDHHGQRYWFNPHSRPALPATSSPALYLLPAFDEYLLGYKDRSAVLDPAHTRHVVGNNGLVSGTLIIAGRIAAVWKRELDKHGAHLNLTALRPLRKHELTALDHAAQRYGQFIGQPIHDLRITS